MEAIQLKILIVEDDEICCKVLYMNLEKLGYKNIDKAYSASSALTLFKDNRYDVIFSDIHMPNSCGIELAENIREIESHRNTYTSIIAVTATMPDKEFKELSKKVGIDTIINKPYKKDEIENALIAVGL
jgi:two-component system aerobic respiration control sensor histidine kinase ArcB